MDSASRLRRIGLFPALVSLTFFVVLLWSNHPLRGDIVIEGDDWDLYTEIVKESGGGNSLPGIVTTDDGVKNLHFPEPDTEMFVTYVINVTQLPGGGPGPERFIIRGEIRNANGNSGMAIRNLTVAPLDPTLPLTDSVGQQASFAVIGIHANLGDNVKAVGSGPQPFDPCVDAPDVDPAIIEVDWADVGSGGVSDPTAGTVGIFQTTTVMVDLVLGLNEIRLDPTDVRGPGPLECKYDAESGHQVFSLTFGPGVANLQGELPLPCRLTAAQAERTLSTDEYEPGDMVTVTVSATNVSASTISETFPDGWTVEDAGGGTVEGNTLRFGIDADGDSSYVLRAPDGVCEAVSVNGTIMETGGGCSFAVGGDSNLRCTEPSGPQAAFVTRTFEADEDGFTEFVNPEMTITNLGHSATSDASGDDGSAGELCGTFARTNNDNKSWIATPLDEVANSTQNLFLRGHFNITANNGANGKVRFGFFNTETASFSRMIAIQVREPGSQCDDPPNVEPFPFRVRIRAPGDSGDRFCQPGGVAVPFNLTWTGNPDGSGTLEGTIGEVEVSNPGDPGIVFFDSIAIVAGGEGNSNLDQSLDLCLDNLTYGSVPGRTETFDSDEGGFTELVNPEMTITNLAHSATSDASGDEGSAGELCGTFARTNNDNRSWIAAPLETRLNTAQDLYLKGHFNITANNDADGEVRFGFFNTETASFGRMIAISIREPGGSCDDAPNVEPFPFRVRVRAPGDSGDTFCQPGGVAVPFNLTWTGNPDGSGTLEGTIGEVEVSNPGDPGIRFFDSIAVVAGGGSTRLAQSLDLCLDNITFGVSPTRTEQFDNDLGAFTELVNPEMTITNLAHAATFDASGDEGSAGELCGTFARTDNNNLSWIAAPLETLLNSAQDLSLKGHFNITADNNSNQEVHVGFFNTETASFGDMIAIHIREPGGNCDNPPNVEPFPFRMQIRAPGDSGGEIFCQPGGVAVPFNLTWTGNPDGSGTLEGTIGEVEVSHPGDPGIVFFNSIAIVAEGGSTRLNQSLDLCVDNLTYTVGSPPALTGGTQLAGDCNQDGEMNVSDIICSVGMLFPGFNLLSRSPPASPCGSADGDAALLDFDGDGTFSTSDVVGYAAFLFQNGPPPQAGTDCTLFVDCPDNAACP